MNSTSQIPADRIKRAIEGRWNPIRGLAPETLGRQLDAYHAGDLGVARTWEAIATRDDLLAGVIPKRKEAVGRMRWEIVINEALAKGREAEAKRQQEVLAAFYSNLRVTATLKQDELGGVGLLAAQILDAKANGWSVHEWVWHPPRQGGEATATFWHTPLWWFENRTGRLRYLRDDFQIYGEAMDATGWLVSAARPLMEPCSVAWMFKSLSLKDWLNLSEKFGMPGLIIKTEAPIGSPEWEAIKTAFASFGQDFIAILSQGASHELIEAGNLGNLPYPPLVERMDRMMAALWRGGDLATMSKGGDAVGANPQAGETEQMEQDDARFVTETLNLRVDPYVLAYKFGEEVEPLAYFKLCPPLQLDTDRELKVDQFLRDSGVPISVKDVRERYNRAEPGPKDDLLTAPAKPAPAPGRAGEFANDADDLRARTLAALQGDVQPVLAELAAILQINDPRILTTRLLRFQKDLPSRLADINAAPASVAALQKELERALLHGMDRALQASPEPRA